MAGMRVADSVILLTGSSGGIGAVCARHLADHGAQLIMHGRDAGRVDTLAANLSAKAIHADLRDPEAPARLAAAALEVYGRVDAVVHCAGVGWYGAAASMPVERLDTLVRVNLGAPIELTQALLPQMLERGTGNITFLASIAGWTGVAYESVYAATKAAVLTYADSLRFELAGSGVSVSVISPAAVRTEFFDRRGEAYTRRIPRPVSPERVTAAVARGIERGTPHQMIPRWLAIAPAVRTTLPAVFRQLNQRFGHSHGAA